MPGPGCAEIRLTAKASARIPWLVSMRWNWRISRSMSLVCWRWICTLDCQPINAIKRMANKMKMAMKVAVSRTVDVRQTWANRLTGYSRIM